MYCSKWNHEQVLANTKLIAAAPDLAEALNTLLIALDAPVVFHPKLGPQWLGPAISNAKAALKKAGIV